MLCLRKIIFYLFVLIYLILCPLIIARMLGFVINPQTHRLVKTGLIYVSTNPPGADVFVDGRQAHEKTPTTVRDLPPGDHFIRLHLEKYKDFEKNIPVVEKKASVLENTLLIPAQWSINQISTKAYENIITSAANHSILVGLNPILKNIDVIRLDRNSEQITPVTLEQIPLFPDGSIYANGRLLHLFSTDKSPFILLEVMIEEKHKFLWADLKENPIRIEDISELFPQTPTTIIWDSSDDKNIFAFYPENIYKINVKAKAIYPQQISQIPEAIRLAQPKTKIVRSFFINGKKDLLTLDKAQVKIYPKDEAMPKKGYNVVQTKHESSIYFYEKTGELFFLDDKTQFLNSVQILKVKPMLNIPIPDSLRIKKEDHNK